MIDINIRKNKQDWPLQVKVIGHAGSGPYGYDVMCASVSTLCLNFLNSLEVLADYQPNYQLNQKDGGYLLIDLSAMDKLVKKETARILYDSFQLGLSQLGADSPEFVRTVIRSQD
ncbi:ribosomal-processing cysteine protease Prp [Streptococcus cuniculipharyngis]|uniref:Ribosomal processing cysteine protease Prp n=1 Tax=Streptococcus cuniculipharyngis TaxID=1562651 RepID=A0A5C5SDK1_9STRE|nr:ribosomal-processing cysteine protease Prp [Streptococcus cuniculipharyngis]TWS99177.1 ribosomal-processing cysteine protease Prp [Streptococcus cuniculipharyngis]